MVPRYRLNSHPFLFHMSDAAASWTWMSLTSFGRFVSNICHESLMSNLCSRCDTLLAPPWFPFFFHFSVQISVATYWFERNAQHTIKVEARGIPFHWCYTDDTSKTCVEWLCPIYLQGPVVWTRAEPFFFLESLKITGVLWRGVSSYVSSLDNQ